MSETTIPQPHPMAHAQEIRTTRAFTDSIVVGLPISVLSDRVQVYPLQLTGASKKRSHRSIREVIGKGVTITECANRTQAGSLDVENETDVGVFIPSGLLLGGLTRNRLVARPLFVHPKTQVRMQVAVVEDVGWASDELNCAWILDTLATASIRSTAWEYRPRFSPSGPSGEDQRRVWELVERTCKVIGQPSIPTDLVSAIESTPGSRELTDAIRDMKSVLVGAHGLAVVIDGQLELSEIYGSSADFSELANAHLQALRIRLAFLRERPERTPLNLLETTSLRAHIRRLARGEFRSPPGANPGFIYTTHSVHVDQSLGVFVEGGQVLSLSVLPRAEDLRVPPAPAPVPARNALPENPPESVSLGNSWTQPEQLSPRELANFAKRWLRAHGLSEEIAIQTLEDLFAVVLPHVVVPLIIELTTPPTSEQRRRIRTLEAIAALTAQIMHDEAQGTTTGAASSATTTMRQHLKDLLLRQAELERQAPGGGRARGAL